MLIKSYIVKKLSPLYYIHTRGSIPKSNFIMNGEGALHFKILETVGYDSVNYIQVWVDDNGVTIYKLFTREELAKAQPLILSDLTLYMYLVDDDILKLGVEVGVGL